MTDQPTPTPGDLYVYSAELLDVHDGDTCYLDVDLGFTTHVHQHVRLAHFDAPELHEADGQRAKERFAELLAEPPLTIRTTRDRREKYGRMLAQIVNSQGVDVGAQLAAEGLAHTYEGGRR